jgi:hypothetical protein
VLCAAGVATADPSTLDAHITEGIAAYRKAMDSASRPDRVAAFRRAERAFEAAIRAGAVNGDLYANLGNAALQGERLGPAILAYRRALLVDPGNARARQNLRHARTLLPDWVPIPQHGGLLDSFFVWHRSTALATKRLGAAATCLAMAIALGFAIVTRSSVARTAAIAFGLTFALLLASIATDPAREADRAGVIVVDDTLARAADSINAPRRFTDALPGGTEVRITADRGGWVQIELANGRNAWVTASSVARIGAPPATP